jgi:hypothetical protein
MTYTDFYNEHINGKLDFDGIAGNQCVDLAKGYPAKVWNIPVHSVGYSGGAKDIMRSGAIFKDSDVNRIPNTPNGVPPKGAVVVFDSTLANRYGHVGIVDSADKNWIYVLEQNGGSGNGDGVRNNRIRVTKYGYTTWQQGLLGKFGVGKCLGWVVPRNGQLTNQ